MTRDQAYQTLGRIRVELHAGRFALAYVRANWTKMPEIFLAAAVNRVTDDGIRRCAENLEVTFVLRLFSEFEAVLRDYWKRGIGKSTEPDMKPLMESIGRRRGMDSAHLAMAHEIRNYRNEIIHEGLRSSRFNFSQCMQALSVYLKWLPLTLNW